MIDKGFTKQAKNRIEDGLRAVDFEVQKIKIFYRLHFLLY